MKKIAKTLAGLLSTGVTFLLAVVIYVQYVLPENLQLSNGEEFYINDKLSIVATEDGDNFVPKVIDKVGKSYRLTINLTGPAPAQEVISYTEQRMVIPGGTPFGIKMYTDGILVVGMSDILIGTENVNPAKEGGLKIGDIVTHINSEKLHRGDDVKHHVAASAGDSMIFQVMRGTDELELVITPVLSQLDGGYKAGIWVRDSSAGIGTLTYYDPQTSAFAGLGHAVCDIDTGAVMPLSSGEVVDVNISGVNAGQSGKPGELKGTFTSEQPLGYLQINCECGLFGVMNTSYFGGESVPMANKFEAQPGKATILSTISGNKPQSFDIMIEKVNYSDISPTKNMVIKITDPQLLAATGGIVQGMSGSPIIQNGKLIGAITHVFVNDPTRGYGIFAENMDKQLKNVENGSLAA